MTTANRPAAKTRYELWQDTIAGALTDARWHEYDCDLQGTATEFNRHLADTRSYSAFDWRMIKAMIWTESGGPTHREWWSNPMQIGNPGDPGLCEEVGLLPVNDSRAQSVRHGVRAMKLKIMLAAALVSTAVDAAAPVFTGRFLGTGRACYGSLVIRDKTMSWLTTFSQCRSLPYEVIERGDDGAGPSRLTFRLTRSVPACKYQVVSLTHNGVDEGIGWEVTGYGNDRSFAADRAGGYKANTPDMMSCYLIRDPGVEPARTPR